MRSVVFARRKRRRLSFYSIAVFHVIQRKPQSAILTHSRVACKLMVSPLQACGQRRNLTRDRTVARTLPKSQ